MSKEEKNKNIGSEPQAEYHKQEIGVFNSIEEMNEHQYRHWISLTPAQRLAEHYLLIKQFYNYSDHYSLYDTISLD